MFEYESCKDTSNIPMKYSKINFEIKYYKYTLYYPKHATAMLVCTHTFKPPEFKGSMPSLSNSSRWLCRIFGAHDLLQWSHKMGALGRNHFFNAPI